MKAPQRRQCRLCGQLAPQAELELIGRTESRPGWCGGPAQGGRPVFAHAACIAAQEARDAAAAADRAERKVRADDVMARARAARDAGDSAEYQRLLDEALELVSG